MNLFAKKNRFKGVFSQPNNQNLSQEIFYNMELLIKEVNTNSKTFSGEMIWNGRGNSKTKVRGKYVKDNVYIVEYELIEGEGVSFPTLYEGKIIDTSISGIAKHANYQGTFYLEKQ